MAARTTLSVSASLLLVTACGAANAPPNVAPASSLTAATAADSTVPDLASVPTTVAEAGTTELRPADTTTSATVDATLQAEFVVEGVMLTVTLPDGAVPDTRKMPPAPIWAPVSESWLVPGCACTLGFVVQTFVPPRYEPDLVETFDGGALTWKVYTAAPASYLAAADTPDGLAVHLVGNGAPLDVIRTVASSVTTSGVRDEPLWDGQVDVDVATGSISAQGFNEFIDTRQPVEARTASGTAVMLVGQNDDATETVQTEEPGADRRTIVTITKSNLMDDSVYAVRYQIELQQQVADTLFRFISGTWTQQCQPGRGHQDFQSELCV
jgi:hypothetical protein